MITKTTRRPVMGNRRPVTAAFSISARAQRTNAPIANRFAGLTPDQAKFARQLQRNAQRQASVMAATNTTNIMARPDFLELLPLFVQKLLVLDVFGSVAMNSRQQLIPYFKVVAENTKGETLAGDIMNSPFVNRQGIDPNFTSKTIKNEVVAEGTAIAQNMTLNYTPILPNSVTIKVTAAGVTTSYVDDGNGNLCAVGQTAAVGYINYSTGAISFTTAPGSADGDVVKATYQYDNENVGPRVPGNGNYGYEYGAQMGKLYLDLDEINMVAEAHELACYWSIYSAFAAQKEYGANIADLAKEAAISEITAEINSKGFYELFKASTYNPAFNWDASPVLNGAVVPSDYLNMFKLKLNQASADIYQKTRLTRPNRLIVGSNVATYLKMIDGFRPDSATETVGPYKVGDLDEFAVYCEPSYNPDTWVMCAKSQDIRRNSALYGEYMPITNTDVIGLANASAQQGYASMYSYKVVNPSTIVQGKILGTF